MSGNFWNNLGSGGEGGKVFYVPLESPFSDNSARDVWANANTEQLFNNEIKITLVRSGDDNYLWGGLDQPEVYDPNQWIDITPAVYTAGPGLTLAAREFSLSSIFLNLLNSATPSSTANTLVLRDSSSRFSGGLTATSNITSANSNTISIGAADNRFEKLYTKNFSDSGTEVLVTAPFQIGGELNIPNVGTGVLRTSGSGFVTGEKVVNADVSETAAISYSKLNLAGSIINADVSSSAAIAYSKLNLSNSIKNSDVISTAAISYSKLNLAGSIIDADISSSAAIADTKLATISTAGKVNNSATTATSVNVGGAIVSRDVNGNFAVGGITGNLIGNATTATTATNATNISITNDTTTDATAYPLFVITASGNQAARTASNKFGFNPSTGVISGFGVDFRSDSGLVNIKSPSGSISSYNLVLPGVQGAANTYLKNDGDGNLSWETTTSEGDISQGGDMFGASVVIGALDNYGLNFITNSIPRISISNNGLINLPGQSALRVLATDSTKNITGLNYSSINTAFSLAQRDISGNFSAGTITASLTGAASLNVLKSGDTMTGDLIISRAAAGEETKLELRSGTVGTPGAGNSTLIRQFISSESGAERNYTQVFQQAGSKTEVKVLGPSDAGPDLFRFETLGTFESQSNNTGYLKLMTLSPPGTKKFWIGFSEGTNVEDSNDSARIGVDMKASGEALLVLQAGKPQRPGSPNTLDLGYVKIAELGHMFTSGSLALAGQIMVDSGFCLQLPNSINHKAKAHSWEVYSDERLKDVHKKADPEEILEKLMSVDPLWVKWKPGHGDNIQGIIPELHLSFIAQNVAKYFPTIVGYDKDRIATSVDYGRMVVPLLAGLKAAISRIDSMSDRIAKLESTIPGRR